MSDEQEIVSCGLVSDSFTLEYLPQVIRDKCTQLRELDLTVQNASSRVDKQAKEFFAVAGNMAPEEKDKTFKKIKENYMRSLEVADEKVRLAEQMSDTVKFQLRAIDEELLKYQAELEVDHPGITPILQKHSLLLDEPELGSRKSRRSRNSSNKKKSQKVKKRATLSQAVSTATASASASAASTSSASASATVTSATAAKDGFLVPPAIPSSTVIAAAASQAIAATKKMQQGRRTASLKASYEAIDVGMHDLGLGRKVVAGTAKEASRKRQRRKSGGVAGMQLVPEATEEYAPESTGELVPGINEPTYCSCNQVSYGNMVACDNKDCKIEWFHYSCVGIQTPPEGKWYCPRCSVAMKDSAN